MEKLPLSTCFGIFMPLFYLAMAAALTFTRLFEIWVQRPAAYYFAGAFLLYGLFRIYRIFR